MVMADPEAIWEIERGVSLVCLGEEGATDGGTPLLGLSLCAFVDTCDRSEARMESRDRRKEQIE